ncbi:hypothetical protein [Maribacter sp. 2308TA10-17]|uniref:hypothetical protein n=1 Tax=Maribacter sp. 2308TA10-17 TaxID=3386276 RepID=UPI0039BCCD28
MKTKTFLLITFILTNLYSCCTECDDDGYQGLSRVHEEKSFPGFFKINSTDIVLSEISSTNNSANDQASLNDLPGQMLSDFSMRMFVPTDNSVTIEASIGDIFILKSDGNNAPAFFEGSTIDEIADLYDEGINRQGYTYRFSYPNNAPKIDRSNLKGFSFQFKFSYLDLESGQLIENKTFEYTVNLQFN